MAWVVRGFKRNSSELRTLKHKFGIIRASDDGNGKLDPRFWPDAGYQRKVATLNPKMLGSELRTAGKCNPS